MRFIFSLAVAAALAVAGFAGDYKLTGENTKIGFTGTKKDGKHVGTFPKLTGTVSAPDGKIAGGTIEVTIDMTGVESDHPGLTEHLKGADFFDVKTNPKSSFKTSEIKANGDKFSVTGDFTLNGKKKTITFPATITMTDKGYSFVAEFKIDRTDYGIKYGQGKIDNEVAITVNLTAK